MKRLIYLIFSIFFAFGFSQKPVQTKFIKESYIKAETLFGIDTFDTIYYSDENESFYKKSADTTISYANFQLGKITSANVFNPLKINLFYQDFNTVVLLDNRLAEIQKIDFNSTMPYRNVTHISTGFDNTLWLFNQDSQYLELYDYINKKTRVKTVPIQSQVIDLKSDYNYCYLLTENYLYIYSYFGSLISKIENNGFTKIALGKSNMVLKADDKLYILQKNTTQIKGIETLDLLINQFLVTNETLYIYNDEKLRRYQLKFQ